MGFTSAGSGRYVASGHPDPRLGAVVFAIVVALRNRIRQPTMMIWVVLGLLAAGRFIEFFARSDSATTLLGLETAQWTSLLLIAFALAGAVVARRVRARPSADDHRASR